jgi:hypothetical protein
MRWHLPYPDKHPEPSGFSRSRREDAALRTRFGGACHGIGTNLGSYGIAPQSLCQRRARLLTWSNRRNGPLLNPQRCA